MTTQTEMNTEKSATEYINKNKVNLAQGCEPVDSAVADNEKVNKTQDNRIAETVGGNQENSPKIFQPAEDIQKKPENCDAFHVDNRLRYKYSWYNYENTLGFRFYGLLSRSETCTEV